MTLTVSSVLSLRRLKQLDWGSKHSIDFDDGNFLKTWDGNDFFNGFSMVLPPLDHHH